MLYLRLFQELINSRLHFNYLFMSINVQRPILIGGVGLSVALWLLASLYRSLENIEEIAILFLLGFGVVSWWWKQQTPITLPITSINNVEKDMVEKAIAKVKTAISQLETEIDNFPENNEFHQQLNQVMEEIDRPEKRLAIIGGKSVGKTTVKILLEMGWGKENQQSVICQETPPLFTINDSDTIIKNIEDNDLVLFITNGDLTEPELQTIQKIIAAGIKTILVFNKEDQYLPPERKLILQQLKQRVQGIIDAEDVINITAAPKPIKVVQYQPDGNQRDWQEIPAPEIAKLSDRLQEIFTTSGQQLVWASSLRHVNKIKTEVQEVLNKFRRDRALPIIEQSQWIAAATAFANPIPALDLLATTAITAQLVIDLGNIYQQKFSLQQGQTAAVTLSKLMVKLGLVEIATQTIGNILKSNTITFVAVGAVQGISAAYLTRLAGLSLIEYFQAQDISINEDRSFNLEKLGETLEKVFQENQRMAFLQSFVKNALSHVIPEKNSPKIVSS